MSFLAATRRFPLSYLLALFATLATVAFKLALDPWIGHASPFFLFLGVVTLMGWYGGFGPGILATIASAVLAICFFLSPTHNLSLGYSGYFQTGVFLGQGCLVSLLMSRWRTYNQDLSIHADRQTTLAQLSQAALTVDDNINPLFARAVQACRQSLEARNVTLLEWDSKNERGIVQAQFNPSNEDEEPLWEAGPGTLLGAILGNGSPLAVARLSEKSWKIPTSLSLLDAVIGVPIGGSERTYGALLVSGQTDHVWAHDEIEFLTALAGILAVAIERSMAVKARRGSEQRYRAFVEQSSEAIWCFEFVPSLDLSLSEDAIMELGYERGFLLECNDTYAHRHGYHSASEALGVRLADLMPRENPDNENFLRTFLRSDYNLSDTETVEVDGKGQQHELSSNLIGIVENGYLERAWGTQRDITVQKQAAAQLRASEERFRALFDAAPVPISITREGTLLYVNRASADLLGATDTKELIGQNILRFVSPPQKEDMQKRIERRAAGEKEPLVYEATGVRLDGTSLPLRIEVTELKLPDGQATLGFAFDLTEEKTAQAQRAQLLEKERRAAQRAQRLQIVTAALAGALTTADVAHTIVEEGVATLEGTSGALCVPGDDENGLFLGVIDSIGYSREIVRNYGRFPMREDSPWAAVRSYLENCPIWLRNLEEMLEAFPIFKEVVAKSGTQAVCALPLAVEGRVLGVLSLSFISPQEFDADEKAFMLTLAGQCAQALERVRLLSEARDAARMQKESLALLDTLLNSAPVGFAFFDTEGRHVLVNQTLSQLDGLPAEAHLGRTILEILPEMGGTISKTVQQVIETGLPSGELEIVAPMFPGSEEMRHCLSSFYPVRTRSGSESEESNELLGVGAVVLDVTARLRGERERMQLLGELEIERARFETILQQMPSAVMIAEAPTGRLILGNPQVEQVFGFPYIASSNIEEYVVYRGFHPDGHELAPGEWPLARAIEKGETVTGEEIVVARGDNTMGVIHMNAAPIRDRDGHITAGVVVFDNVTERARSDAAQRFLAEAGSAMVSSLDEQYIYDQLATLSVPRVADWCLIALVEPDGFLKAIATTHADAEKAPLAQRLKDQFATDARFPWDIQSVLKNQKGVLDLEHDPDRLLAAGTGEKYIALMAEIGVRSAITVPLFARGRALGVMIWLTAESGRVYDETDLKLAEELARRAALTADNARLLYETEAARDAAQFARDEAQNANRAKDEFLAVVSHELRTPLTPIMGWLEILRDPAADANIRTQAYDVIERNAKAQAQLVNDVLDVSRITTGKLRLEAKVTSLSQIVERAVESLRMSARERGLRLETSIQDVGEVRADANRLQQVVWNLLQNSLKFTPSGGWVRVTIEREEDLAILRIQDSGQGIDTAFLPYVFDRFRQADSSSTRRAGGLGLGLAIVQHIVELHGGRVCAQSDGLGQGATFIVELPLLVQPVPVPKPEAPSGGIQGWPSLAGLRILTVDDEPDTRDMLATLLEIQGARVQVALSASVALEVVEAFKPDIVISDIGMPVIDGYELCRRLKSSYPDLPMIALTAYAAPDDMRKAQEAGFAEHLSKPVDAAKLLGIVVRLVGKTGAP